MLNFRQAGVAHLENARRVVYYGPDGQIIGTQYEPHVGPAPASSGRVFLVAGDCVVRRATVRQMLSRCVTVIFCAPPTREIRGFVDECRERDGNNLHFIGADPNTFDGQKQLLRDMRAVTTRPDGLLFMEQPRSFFVATHDASGMLNHNRVRQISPFSTAPTFTADDVAAKIVFLFSADGQHLTGQTLLVGIAAGNGVPALLTGLPLTLLQAKATNQRAGRPS